MNLSQLSFDQRLDVLWSSCALGKEESIREIYEDLQTMNFQRMDNDLTYQQYCKLRDSLIYLGKVSKPKWCHPMSPCLELIAENPHTSDMRYGE